MRGVYCCVDTAGQLSGGRGTLANLHDRFRVQAEDVDSSCRSITLTVNYTEP